MRFLEEIPDQRQNPCPWRAENNNKSKLFQLKKKENSNYLVKAYEIICSKNNLYTFCGLWDKRRYLLLYMLLFYLLTHSSLCRGNFMLTTQSEYRFSLTYLYSKTNVAGIGALQSPNLHSCALQETVYYKSKLPSRVQGHPGDFPIVCLTTLVLAPVGANLWSDSCPLTHAGRGRVWRRGICHRPLPYSCRIGPKHTMACCQVDKRSFTSLSSCLTLIR